MVKFSSLLDFINIVSLSVGVTTITTSKTATRSYRFLKKWGKAYSLVRLLIIAIDVSLNVFWMASFVYALIQRQRRSIVGWIQVLWWSMLHVSAYASFLFSLRSRKRIYEVTDILIGIDARLGLYDTGWSDGTVISLILTFALDMVVPAVVAGIFFVYAKREEDMKHLYYSLVVMYHLLLSLIVELQFRMLVLFVARANRKIREKMTSLLGPELEYSTVTWLREQNTSVGADNEGSTESCSRLSRQISGSVPVGSYGSRPFLDLMEMHLQLYHCKRNADKSYGWQTFLKSIYDLCDTTFIMYGIASAAISEELTDVLVHAQMIMACSWFALVTAKGVAEKVSACEQLNREENLTRIILSRRIIGRKPSREIHELSQFYEQTRHTTHPMTGNGFFVLRNSLITTVLGSVITYVFIMLQFQVYSKDYTSIFDTTFRH